MIHYTLRCDNAHSFDGWFASSQAFDRQKELGLLTCPQCGSAEVARGLMAPAVRSTRRSDAGEAAAAPGVGPGTESEGETAPGTAAEVALVDERAEKLRTLIKAMHAAVKEAGVDVGRRFPEEARRIHYGEAEARGIYGQADPDEARALVEEGIDILPLPTLPDEQN